MLVSSLRRRLASCAFVFYLQSVSAVSRQSLMRDARSTGSSRAAASASLATIAEEIGKADNKQILASAGGMNESMEHPSENERTQVIPASLPHERIKHIARKDLLSESSNRSGGNLVRREKFKPHMGKSVTSAESNGVQSNQEPDKTMQVISPDGTITAAEDSQPRAKLMSSQSLAAQPIAQILANGQAETEAAFIAEASAQTPQTVAPPSTTAAAVTAAAATAAPPLTQATVPAAGTPIAGAAAPAIVNTAPMPAVPAPEEGSTFFGLLGSLTLYLGCVTIVSLGAYWLGQRRGSRARGSDDLSIPIRKRGNSFTRAGTSSSALEGSRPLSTGDSTPSSRTSSRANLNPGFGMGDDDSLSEPAPASSTGDTMKRTASSADDTVRRPQSSQRGSLKVSAPKEFAPRSSSYRQRRKEEKDANEFTMTKSMSEPFKSPKEPVEAPKSPRSALQEEYVEY